MSIEKKMQTAAHDGARLAAGEVFGEAITEARPGLPALQWSAIEMNGTWYASGTVAGAGGDALVRRIVAAWATALGGSEPYEIDQEESGTQAVETRARFGEVEVTVWGIVLADQ